MLNGIRLGDKIAADVKGYGITAGTPITDLQLQQIWELISTDIVAEFTANADVLPATHNVLPLTNPIGQHIAVTTGPGSGSTGATDVPQVITGTGSVQ